PAPAHKLASRLSELLPHPRGKIEMGVQVQNQYHPFLCLSPSRGRRGKGKLLMQILSFLFVAFSAAPSHAAEFKPDWQAEWEGTVQAAKKEGVLSLYLLQGHG